MRTMQRSRGFALVLSLLSIVVITLFGLYAFRAAALKSKLSSQGLSRIQIEHELSTLVDRARKAMLSWTDRSQFEMPLTDSGQIWGALHYFQGTTTPIFTPPPSSQVAIQTFFAQRLEPQVQLFLTDLLGAVKAEEARFNEQTDHSYLSGWIPLVKNMSGEVVRSSDGSLVRYRLKPARMATRNQPEDFGPDLIFSFDYEIEVANGIDEVSREQDKNSVAIFGREIGRLEINVIIQPSLARWGLIREANNVSTGGAEYFTGAYSNGSVSRPAEYLSGRIFSSQRFNAMGNMRVDGSIVSSVSSANPTSSDSYSGSLSYESYRYVPNGSAPSPDTAVDLPNSITNIVRLAAGDTDPRLPDEPAPAHDLSALDNDRLRSWLDQGYIGKPPGGMPSGIPEDIYITTTEPFGHKETRAGIYVNGDLSKLRLNVHRAEDNWSSVNPTHLGLMNPTGNCNLQMIDMEISVVPPAVPPRKTIYMTSSNCSLGARTFVFTGASLDENLEGNLNGQIYVKGKIAALGNESRSSAAIAKDRQFNIAASGDIIIDKDLQYEDARYVIPDGDPLSQDPVFAANPWLLNPVEPTNPLILAPRIDADSKTLLGIVSAENVLLKNTDAQSELGNLNLHALVYAAMKYPNSNPAAYVDPCERTGGNSSCGFGWADPLGKLGIESCSPTCDDDRSTISADLGQLRLLGSVIERRPLGISAYYPNPGSEVFRGFVRRYHWDQRARNLRLLGFPSSDAAYVEAEAIPSRSLELGASGEVVRRSSN